MAKEQRNGPWIKYLGGIGYARESATSGQPDREWILDPLALVRKPLDLLSARLRRSRN